MKTVLNVKGMSCAHCVAAVNKALSALEGVERVLVDLEGEKVSVEYDDTKVDVEAMKEAIEDQGYDVV